MQKGVWPLPEGEQLRGRDVRSVSGLGGALERNRQLLFLPRLLPLRRADDGVAEAARADSLQGKAIRYYREALTREPRNLAAIAGEGEALVEKGAIEKEKPAALFVTKISIRQARIPRSASTPPRCAAKESTIPARPAIAMAISGPIGLMAAIHLAFYASASARAWMKPVLELIAGIPTVVWGSFAALTLGPQVRMIGEALGLEVASESALAAGLAMGVMIIPFVSSLSDDALNAVPRSLREASLAMGATESETIRKVMVPAALPGIVGAFLLAVSRGIGETMIVVMAAGLAANMTANPFAAVTTVTVQILTLLVGDQEFDSAKTLAAFALGLTLFFVTLCLNLVALIVVRRFREEYE